MGFEVEFIQSLAAATFLKLSKIVVKLGNETPDMPQHVLNWCSYY